MVMVALTATITIVLARYQHRKTKGGRERGVGKRGNKKIKMKNNKRGGPCDQAKGFPLMFFKNLQTPGARPCLGSIPKGVIHKKHVQKHQNC
jgi:hypothetical protein